VTEIAKQIRGRIAEDLRETPDRDRDGRPVIAVDFTDSTFVTDVDFSGFVFRTACFDGVTFNGGASFRDAVFEDCATFPGVIFEKAVSFAGSKFSCPARFEYTEADDPRESARQREVTFGGWADFRVATFESGALFGGAVFDSRARFDAATCGNPKRPYGFSFEGARFRNALTLGPMLAHGAVSLDRATFEAPSVRIALSAARVSAVRTHFIARTQLEARYAKVSLEDAEFAQPSIVGGAPSQFRLDESGELLDDSNLPGSSPRPRIASLARANVANLTLTDCDLRECCFVGAHNLDGLRFEAVEFERTTRPRTRRRMIAEEGDRAMSRARLARTYRALRKGREDNKDEPGAADFYYGEMEMRRQASYGFELALLRAYWAVSGYGLRASRAFAALALTIVAGGVAFAAFSGFDPDQELGKSLLFSAESTSSLLRAPNPPEGAVLNDEGHVIQLLVRLFGALFFGLALLALRGRVKR
jgi:uncharacterized protein YjbI with pentapeptide repeats